MRPECPAAGWRVLGVELTGQRPAPGLAGDSSALRILAHGTAWPEGRAWPPGATPPPPPAPGSPTPRR